MPKLQHNTKNKRGLKLPLDEQIFYTAPSASLAGSSSTRTWNKEIQSRKMHKQYIYREHWEWETHYFFFSALWWTRMAAPKAPRPICSMISYWSIRDSIATTPNQKSDRIFTSHHFPLHHFSHTHTLNIVNF